MTRRASDEPLRKVTLDLFVKDHETLQEIYGRGEVARVIRKLIRVHLLTISHLEQHYERS